MTSHKETEPRRNPRTRRGPQDRKSGGLTDRDLPKLGAGEHSDGKLPGLVFRVRQTGGRAWSLLYWFAGRRRRLTLGPWPGLGVADARIAARAARKAISLGKDPAAEKRASRDAGTFGELAKRYIEKWAKPRKRTWKEDQWTLNAHVLPRWRHIPAAEIKRRDVRILLEKVAESAPVGVNRVRALLSKVYNYGISVDVVETNPVTGTERAQEKARNRVLSEDEIRQFWKATNPKASDDDEGLPPAISARFRLLLVTAQRGGEVNDMCWSELDLAAGVWTIPAERSKNKLPHRVPISSRAHELIEPLPREGDYVLAGGRGRRQQREAVVTFGLDDFTGHDLRRTAASYMTSIGIPRFTVARLLNHAESGVTAVYDRHSYDIEKRDALERWALKLRKIIEARPGELVEFPK